MAIGPGTRVGPYEVSALLGEGGMGKVWRAHHTALKRDDAIKVLPEAFVADLDRLARFEREAQLLASLNHPNIARVYGLEQADGLQAIVMEMVEGPTLDDQIAAGPVPTEEALSIAKQIAEALEAAHERGIVHRDLKPANIKVQPEGTVKVLDFGLARTMEPVAPMSPGLSRSPTITSPAMTQAGMIMGTAAYMSPEQARGLQVDHRSDIFSFGCVLYEMLTGRRAFDGRDVGESLALVITREPDLTAIPRHVRPLVSRCLTKERQQRLQAIGEARIAIDALLNRRGTDEQHDGATPAPSSRLFSPVVAVVAVLALAGLGAVTLWQLMPPRLGEAQRTTTRFVLTSPAGVAPRGNGTGRHALAVSPQGTHVVYWAHDQLFVRALGQLGDGVPLRGTEGAREPFFSPDGQWIGFYHQGQLKRVSINGGAPIAVVDAAVPWGVSWNRDGTILYGQGPEGIWRVLDTGGAPERVIAVEPGESAHGPQLLPDGKWLLFTFKPAGTDLWDEAQVVAQSLSTRERIVLVGRGRDARYIPATGHLVYGLHEVLVAAPFDAGTRRVTGAAVPLVEGVMDADVRTGAMHSSVSADGTLVYLTGGFGTRGAFTWVTRENRRQRLPLDPLPFSAPKVARDGARLAVEVDDRRGREIHIYDVARNALMQLTSNPLSGRYPLWTHDSQRVVFYSDADGGGLFVKSADGSGSVERLTRHARDQIPFSWSPDGRTLLFEQRDPDPSAGTLLGKIYTLSLVGDGVPATLLATSAHDGQPTLSPDGHWLAYVSNESSGVANVYVRPFPNVRTARWSVSTNGGHSPLWSPDGKQLFFISQGQAMAVPIETEPTFRPGAATAMFELPPFYRSMYAFAGRQWDIAGDGRLLVIEPAGESSAATSDDDRARVVVVLAWFDELRRLVPAQ